ncbi:MAG: SBBP repeat-containing protein [Bacteroidetes bacterium]|nr:SBBP repeat-containing protein [Bacteroidota bacterium]
MRKTCVFWCALLLTSVVACVDHAPQPHPTAWREGGFLGDVSQSIATDNEGNVYITGTYNGQVTFGSVTLPTTGGGDIFIIKYNRMGVVQWARSAGTFRPESGLDIAVDSQGNVYVTGFFNGSINFGHIWLTAPVAQTGSVFFGEAFVAKYNTNGEVQWAHRAGGTGVDQGESIALDRDGNVFVTGSFQETASFGSATLTATNGSDMFIVKYNTNGEVLWVKKVDGSSHASGKGIATDGSGNVYVTGEFKSAVSLDGESLGSGGDSDVLLAKLNKDGALQWIRSAGGVEGDFSSGIAADESGNVSITGIFRSNATFAGVTLTNNGVYDIFVAHYSTSGTLQWAKGFGGRQHDLAGDITTGKDGSVYVAGSFRESVTVGNQTFKTKETGNATDNISTDLILIKFDKDGTPLWVKQEGGDGFDSNEFVLGITYSSMNELYIIGHFYGTPILSGTTLISAGQNDIFVAKYSE